MPIDQDVKNRAYEIDPDAWKSYSGKPPAVKAAIDLRRNASLSRAQEQIDDEKRNAVPSHRAYSHMAPAALRDKLECGLQEACRKIMAHRLLDQIDEADSVEELRQCLSELVTMVTGET